MGDECVSGQLPLCPQDGGHGAAAGAAGQGEVLHAPLKGQHSDLAGAQHLIVVDVGALGERRVKAQRAHGFPEAVRVSPQVARVLHHRVGQSGISQLHIGSVVLAVQIQRGGAVQPDPVSVLVQPPAVHQPRVGFHGHRVPHNAQAVGKAADAPGAVAAHSRPGAVGIVKMQPEIRLVGVIHRHEAVRAGNGAVFFCQRRKIQIPSPGVDDHEVIASAVHVSNLHKIPPHTLNRLKYSYSGVSAAKKSAASSCRAGPNIAGPASRWRMQPMSPFQAK